MYVVYRAKAPSRNTDDNNNVNEDIHWGAEEPLIRTQKYHWNTNNNKYACTRILHLHANCLKRF